MALLGWGTNWDLFANFLPVRRETNFPTQAKQGLLKTNIHEWKEIKSGPTVNSSQVTH